MNHKICIYLKWKWFCIPIARTNTVVSFNLTSCILGLTGIKIQSPAYPFLGKQALGMGNSMRLTQPMRSGHGTEIKMISRLLVTRSGWEAIHLTLFALKVVFGLRKSISGKYSIFQKCYFPENIPFFGNAIFRKGKCFYVFGCISKNFLKKIFWCLENATRKKTKPEKQTQHPDWRSRLTGFDGAVLRELQSDDCAVDRDLAKHRADHDRREGEFAISDRDWRRWCLRTALTGAWTCERRQLVMLLPLALSLSLSLSLRNSFEVKIGMEIHFRSQSLFFLGQRKSISGKFYFPDQPNTRISKNVFPEMIFTQDSEDA